MRSEIDKIISSQECLSNDNGNSFHYISISTIDTDSVGGLNQNIKPQPLTPFERLTLPSFYNTFSHRENLTISSKELTGMIFTLFD